MNNKRVVVSTNTINLQEQLVNKDVPILVRALGELDGAASEDLKFTQLKGRANYLCMRRWDHLRSSESLTEDEARMLAKTMVWLQTTTTGDRSELNLGNRNTSAPWERLSAQGAVECLSMGGPCFLRSARERAAASHLVIVNHALLLSDVTAGGALIPDYDILIIDEAHHLEEEATTNSLSWNRIRSVPVPGSGPGPMSCPARTSAGTATSESTATWKPAPGSATASRSRMAWPSGTA